MKTLTHLVALAALALLTLLASCTTTLDNGSSLAPPTELWDATRQRQIPLALYFPEQPRSCTRAQRCSVAFLSSGYGLLHTDYSFIASALAKAGYLVVAIQHDLPSDPELSKTGNLFANRLPMWQRGAENIRFVRAALSSKYTHVDWDDLTLIGHSNGGDISALALHESPKLARTLITLDNRRYPLPRASSVRVLSIRASDFEADAGVLPTAQERADGTCITTIAGSRHNDMNDHGPIELQTQINALILPFIKEGRCGA